MSMNSLKRRGQSPAPAPGISDTENAFFRMEKINKSYRMGEEQAHILKDVDLSLERGE